MMHDNLSISESEETAQMLLALVDVSFFPSSFVIIGVGSAGWMKENIKAGAKGLFHHAIRGSW